MKRFYTLVSTRKDADGFVVELDGKPVKTPLKAPLKAATKDLANAILAEWSAQEDDIQPNSMPLTQILSTQIDKTGPERQIIHDKLLKFLDTDLLCYRAPEPPALKAAQEKAWDGYLKSFETRFGPMKTTEGLAALSQDHQTTKAVQDHIAGLSDSHFNLVQLTASLSGSLVLAIAFIEKTLSAEEIFAAMRVEENFKAQIYNEDFYGQDPAQEEKDNAIKAELKSAEAFLSFLL